MYSCLFRFHRAATFGIAKNAASAQIKEDLSGHEASGQSKEATSHWVHVETCDTEKCGEYVKVEGIYGAGHDQTVWMCRRLGKHQYGTPYDSNLYIALIILLYVSPTFIRTIGGCKIELFALVKCQLNAKYTILNFFHIISHLSWELLIRPYISCNLLNILNFNKMGCLIS